MKRPSFRLSSSELPELGGGFSAYVSGRRECVFYGVKKVLRLDSDRVTLLLSEGVAEVCGRDLCLRVFCKGGASVCGKTDCIRFEGDGEQG